MNALPHDTYEYLGFCMAKGEVVVFSREEEIECGEYREFTVGEAERVIKGKGWIYCATCKSTVFSVEELERHIGHFLTLGIYSDSVASEEAPPAD